MLNLIANYGICTTLSTLTSDKLWFWETKINIF